VPQHDKSRIGVAGSYPEVRLVMQPLADMPSAVAGGVRALLTDIDDTLTTSGRLTASAYSALESVHAAGIITVAVTGRPGGWCDHFARMWPVDAVIGENGAFYFQYQRRLREMRRHFWAPAPERAANHARLRALGERILAAVPGSAFASDQPYRLSDLAIDYCEDVASLPPSSVDQIVALFEEAGAHAKVSSIHVNGWFGGYDKLRMAEVLLRDVFDLEPSSDAIVYVGDSPNDEPMFSAFPLSVGVANVENFAHRLRAKPAYVTPSPSGAGFAELSDHLLSARRASRLANADLPREPLLRDASPEGNP
jgi:HAD superfamily hydrolase (TIGR01484 family)